MMRRESPPSPVGERSAQARSSDTKELLLEAAKKIFAAKGYDGATVKELADAAGVNVSLVSYYFEGKEGIYRTCLERFGQDRLAAAERVLKTAESPEDFRVRLRLFVEELLYCHIEQAELTTIIHREYASEMLAKQPILRDVFGKIFLTLRTFIENAQRGGIIKPELDAHATSTLFFGSLINLSRVDAFHKEIYGRSLEDKRYREQVINDALRVFLGGVLENKS